MQGCEEEIASKLTGEIEGRTRSKFMKNSKIRNSFISYEAFKDIVHTPRPRVKYSVLYFRERELDEEAIITVNRKVGKCHMRLRVKTPQ